MNKLSKQGKDKNGVSPSQSWRSRGAGSSILSLFMLLACAGTPVYGQRGPAPVEVAVVVKQPMTTSQSFVGTVRPLKTATIGSAVDGRVSEYPIEEGDYLEAGAPLAQLLTETIKLELAAAEHEHELRKQELLELENGSRPEEIRRAEAVLAAAKAAKEYHDKQKTRAEELFDRNAINNDEMQLILADQIKADQEYLQALEARDLVVTGPRTEQIAQARAQVAIRKAIVDRLSDQMKKYTIKTPFAGFVTAEHTELGQWVKQGELVAEVIALDKVHVEVFVPEQFIAFVKKGDTVTVEIPALADRLFTGEVDQIIPQADTRSRTFPVKVLVTNEILDGVPLIKSGMMARAHLSTGMRTESLLVPKDSLVLGGQQRMVYVVVPGDEKKPASVRPVPVVVGAAEGNAVAVQADLKPGDQVVIRGNERLRPGQEVTVMTQLAPPAEKQTGTSE